MLSRAWHWIDERWPVMTLFKFGVEEDLVGGANYTYTLGSAIMVVFALQVVTGLWQMFYYVPTVDHAYNSLSYLRTQVLFGWLIHGLHYWGAAAMVVLVGLHMIRVFLWGAYKRPRELTWLMGVVLVLLTMAISFTGTPLPWDERGYWAAQVITSIASTVPVVGDFVERMIIGGETMGQLTLTRFFMMHVAFLPALLAIFIVVHLVALRQFGSVGPWNEAKRQKTGPFWPDQASMDALSGILVILVLIVLTVFAFPPFTGPADPVDTTYVPKPEWNFLFLYQALKFFRGAFEPVGTLGLPIIGVIILILIPFIDRNPERNPAKRPLAMAFLGFCIAAFVGLSFAGYYSTPTGSAAPDPPARAATNDPPQPIKQGSGLFSSLGCAGCHQINGVGGAIGPDLSNEGGKGRSRSWLVIQIQNPKAHNPNSIMPASPQLSKGQMTDLIDYLFSLHKLAAKPPAKPAIAEKKPPPSAAACAAPPVPGVAVSFIGNPDHGAILYAQICESCHGPRGTDGVPNPGSASGMVPGLSPISRKLFSENAQAFAVNLDLAIQNGSTPAGPNPALKMPGFGTSNTLTQPEIAHIEAYIMALNGVNRAQLVNPGVQPLQFFVLAIVILAISALAFGITGWALSARHR